MERFIRKPSIDMLGGIKIDKNTKLEYKNENVEQTIDNLVLKSITKLTGDNFTSEYHTTINLQEGDVLIFEEEGRGYIKPVEEFVSVKEAIEELECIKDL